MLRSDHVVDYRIDLLYFFVIIGYESPGEKLPSFACKPVKRFFQG